MTTRTRTPAQEDARLSRFHSELETAKRQARTAGTLGLPCPLSPHWSWRPTVCDAWACGRRAAGLTVETVPPLPPGDLFPCL